MLKNIEKQKKSNTLILYLYTFFIIYITDSLLFGTNSSRVFFYINRFGIIVVTLVILIKVHITQDQAPKFPFFLWGASASILISSFLAGRILHGYSYYTFIALLWFGFLFSGKYSLEQFSRSFCNVMRIISIVSLIAWLFSDVVRSISGIPIITNTVGLKYKTIFLTSVSMIPHHAVRNMGPFWEPGAYQIYLTIALFLTMFIENHKFKWVDAGLFIITTLSTLSGAALIPVLLIITAYMFEKKNFNSLIIGIIFCGFIFALFLKTDIFDMILIKMRSEDGTSSIVFRWIGIEGGIRGFLYNPLFGSTPEVNENIKSALAIKYMGTTYSSNANTFFNYLGYYGFFVGGIMLLKSYRLFKKNISSTIAVLLAFTAYLFATSNENMTSSILIVVLAFLKNDEEMFYYQHKRRAST